MVNSGEVVDDDWNVVVYKLLEGIVEDIVYWNGMLNFLTHKLWQS